MAKVTTVAKNNGFTFEVLADKKLVGEVKAYGVRWRGVVQGASVILTDDFDEAVKVVLLEAGVQS